MPIKIIEESIETLTEYEKVPIAFWVRSRFLVGLNDSGPTLIEEPVNPYIKDYDAYGPPSQWPERFDVSQWGIFAAFDGKNRIGGATAAWKTPDLEMLENRDDLVCLWDMRVHPDYRHRGVGHRLFEAVTGWARERQCTNLKIETQDINVLACRFYARQGCELRGINKDAYAVELDEIQLLWYRDLRV